MVLLCSASAVRYRVAVMRENSRMMIYTVVNYTAVGGHFLYENTKGADGYLALVLNPPPHSPAQLLTEIVSVY